MSNEHLPNSKQQYNVIEGGLGGGLFILILLVLSLIFGITKCCCSKESFHTLLSVFYSSFSERQKYTLAPATPQAATPQAATQQAATQQAANQQAATLLIWTRNVPTGCNGCLTYTYYCLMAIVACLLFISVAVDYSIFQKITMCSDIDPHDMSHVCFAVNKSYRMVNCSDQQMIPVICYIFNLNFAGIGIAYSIANLCLAVVDVYYIVLMKLTVKCHACIFGLRILASFGAVIGFPVWWGIFRTIGQDIQYDYFGYGLVPMRISQSVLAFMIASIVILLPPWKLDINTVQSYRDLAEPHQIKEKTCSPCCNRKSNRASQEGAVRVDMRDEQVQISKN